MDESLNDLNTEGKTDAFLAVIGNDMDEVFKTPS